MICAALLGTRPVTADDATAKLSKLSETMGAADIVEVRQLLHDGADVNVKNKKFGATCLLRAAQNGNADIVALLLASGADVNLADDILACIIHE